MPTMLSKVALTALILFLPAAGLASSDTGAQPPHVPYWHVWADASGTTHQTECAFKGFVEDQFSPPAPAMWLDRVSGQADAVRVLVLPVGWSGSWHKNPKPQWIIPLSGRWFVETMDGSRVEMGPGEASFGGDQLAIKDDQNRIGHLSGTVGSQAAVLIIVQMKDPPDSSVACPF